MLPIKKQTFPPLRVSARTAKKSSDDLQGAVTKP
jgi:hypothetical protein